MREVFIDLSSDNMRTIPTIIGGIRGEHNETSLVVTLPPRMLSDLVSYYYFKFETSSGESVTSPNVAKSSIVDSNKISISLWNQVTSCDFLKVNVVAETVENDNIVIIGKTPTFEIVMQKDAGGENIVYNPDGNEEILQTAINEALQEAKDSGEFKGDKGDPGKDAVTDQTYNPESENAQSGIAVARAISGAVEKIDYASPNHPQVENVKQALDAIGEQAYRALMFGESAAHEVQFNAVKYDDVQQTYDPESEMPLSGVAFAEGIAAATEWKTLLDYTMTEEQAGVKSCLIAIENAEALANAKKIRIFATIPQDEEYAAGKFWFSARIADYEVSKYNIQLCGDSNVAGTANTKYSLYALIDIAEVSMVNSYPKTFFSLFNKPSPHFGAPANTRGNTINVSGGYPSNRIMTYPPYLNVTITTATFKAGTHIILEVLN